jgi:hypothetical protein
MGSRYPNPRKLSPPTRRKFINILTILIDSMFLFTWIIYHQLYNIIYNIQFKTKKAKHYQKNNQIILLFTYK